MMKLYSGPLSMFGMKAHIAALEKELEVDLVEVPFNEQSGYDPKHPEVLRINPKRQVPVLVDGELEIFDSTQIFEYFEDLRPEPALWPSDRHVRARARLIELTSDEVFFAPVITLMGCQNALKSERAHTAIASINADYDAMEQRLRGHDFLVGSYSYADIAFFMASLFADRMGAPMTSATPRLIEWRDAMAKRSAVKTALQPMIDYLNANGRPVPAFLTK